MGTILLILANRIEVTVYVDYRVMLSTHLHLLGLVVMSINGEPRNVVVAFLPLTS